MTRTQAGPLDPAHRKVASRLRSAVREVFGPKCKVAWLSGSLTYGGARAGCSDIDVVVVFDETVCVPADSGTIGLIERFVDSYLALHLDCGLQPDLDFPGEFLTVRLIQEAIHGRGFACEQDPARISLPTVASPEYWLDQPDRWFRAWLSMTAFSIHLCGNRRYHSAVKLAAWKTILRFVLLVADGRSMFLDEVFENLSEFGLKLGYKAFRALESAWVQRAASQLELEGVVRLAEDRLYPISERLREWEVSVCQNVAAQASFPLFLDIEHTRQVSAYAGAQWTKTVRT